MTPCLEKAAPNAKAERVGAPGSIINPSGGPIGSLAQSQRPTSEEVHAVEVPLEILEMAEEIAAGADGLGIEQWRLEYLLRCVLAADRRARQTSETT